MLVRSGERIPVDGRIVDGDAAVDEAVVTGESLPVRKTAGDAVVGCSMVTDGAVTVRVGEDAMSSLDRISELVWDLQSDSHGIQKLADKLATIFVPVVLALAVIVTGINLLLGNGVSSLLIGLTVLIVSCPCALGLATPLAVAAGIRDALARSIVIFDDSIFERIRDADTVIFDKTGTLTTGEMTVTETVLETELLEKASLLEERSSHPVGNAIAAERSVADDDPSESASDATAKDGRVDAFDSYRNGVRGIVDGEDIIVGHPDLFRDQAGTSLRTSPIESLTAVKQDGFRSLSVVTGPLKALSSSVMSYERPGMRRWHRSRTTGRTSSCSLAMTRRRHSSFGNTPPSMTCSRVFLRKGKRRPSSGSIKRDER